MESVINALECCEKRRFGRKANRKAQQRIVYLALILQSMK